MILFLRRAANFVMLNLISRKTEKRKSRKKLKSISMKKKKPKLLLLMGMGFIAAHAQTTQLHSAMVSAGGDLNGSGGTASYTIGQTIYNTVGTNETAAQGIQQAIEVNVNGVDEFKNITLISVYPNPTDAFINLKIENQVFDQLYFLLSDITGRQVLSQSINQKNTLIDLKPLLAGTYLLTVYNQKQTFKSFSIIKNN